MYRPYMLSYMDILGFKALVEGARPKKLATLFIGFGRRPNRARSRRCPRALTCFGWIDRGWTDRPRIPWLKGVWAGCRPTKTKTRG
jgi:hypothetical protein